MTPEQLDQLAINTVRFLAVDMVEAAKSGHPGAPLGQAPLGTLLYTRILRHDPADPSWPDRDRFVLSCGHASALLYALLHLSGYDLPLEELRRFRQLGSKTPGHPEHGHTPGVETTTGPLGQGLGNAVGMAIAREHLAARFNRPGFDLFTHRIWVIASDGDLMEGVASEASSLAGHLGLGCLKVFWDDNRISIDGSTSLTFTEDVAKRYEAYGWQVLRVADGNDLAALAAAARAAEAETERPTLVAVRTSIGYGSPKQDTAGAHGEPLGAEAARATREKLGWPLEDTFLVPDAARTPFRAAAEAGARRSAAWRELLAGYQEAHPAEGRELARRIAGRLPEGWEQTLPTFKPEDGSFATRQASGKVLNALAKVLPELLGGSADLAGSNNTTISGEPAFSRENRLGRNFHFGVREHAMGSAANGMALSGLLRPYGGTFLIFSDYMRPAIRLAGLMGLPVVYVFTHDSIFLGEDGPTHQPVSQLLSLRSIPNLVTLRPADGNETAAAWKVALERRSGPTALVLTRQKLPTLAQTVSAAAAGVPRGAYVLEEAPGGVPEALLLATGSEVALALEAQEALASEGIAARVVSFPSWELFAAQDQDYRDSVLPPSVTRRLAIEAATPIGWHRWVGLEGDVLGQETYGASAPQADLARHFGYTVEEAVRRVKGMMGGGTTGLQEVG
ncbi:MAG TPA: transketolase [Thermoanaerobaculia bacterium]|nr:transketolase [Thermoanaerobaculia bacterium]